uniref:Immunoglobulin C1-set domain-containing protein n=1 Tax=Astyanax mexicanus TaxID=7994 RepID=A0A3B1JY73_ASTMX
MRAQVFLVWRSVVSWSLSLSSFFSSDWTFASNSVGGGMLAALGHQLTSLTSGYDRMPTTCLLPVGFGLPGRTMSSVVSADGRLKGYSGTLDSSRFMLFYLMNNFNSFDPFSAEKTKYCKSCESFLVLTCVATGFYPKYLNMILRKSGVPISEDQIKSTGVRPSGDGTYNLSKTVEVLGHEKFEYDCYVTHSSLKEPIIKSMYTLILICVYIINLSLDGNKTTNKRVQVKTTVNLC